jgi:hypothetical protein
MESGQNYRNKPDMVSEVARMEVEEEVFYPIMLEHENHEVDIILSASGFHDLLVEGMCALTPDEFENVWYRAQREFARRGHPAGTITN